jgi:hypothetical protein
MSTLGNQLTRKLQPGMELPEPFEELYLWIECKGMFEDQDNRRIGFLYPPDKLRKEWTETETPGGTLIEFYAGGNDYLECWFGHNRSAVLERLCVFAKTGADGSMAAFWIDDEGSQRIVHLGSGSGSTLVCVLTDDPVDFLRLLAIGYDEICWNSAFSQPPNADHEKKGEFVHPNVEFQEWVKETFSVAIPSTADEIVKYLSEMDDDSPNDIFCQWVQRNVGT